MTGRVEAIFVSPEATVLPAEVDRVRAVAGRGLEGDRYFTDGGTWSDHPIRNGRSLTLIEAEAIERAPLSAAEARRNVVTRGISLGDLVGKRFRIGAVECAGRRLCEPCSHLEGLTRPGVVEALAHTGLRADVLTDGEIAVGDGLVALDDFDG